MIKAKFVSENFTNFHLGQVETEAWRFTPQCPEGPCKVKVDLFAPQQKLAVAGRKGGTYTTKGTILLGRCGSSSLTTTVTLSVHVTKANFIGGVWQATAIAGIFTQFTPATFSCQSGSGRQTVRGTLQTG